MELVLDIMLEMVVLLEIVLVVLVGVRGGSKGRGEGERGKEVRASSTKKKGHCSYFQRVTYSISFIMWKTALRTAGRDIFIQSIFCQLQR